MDIFHLEEGETVVFSFDCQPLDSDKKRFPWLNKRVRYYKIVSLAGGGRRAFTYQAIPVDENGAALGPFVALKVPNLGAAQSQAAPNRQQDDWLAKRRDADINQLHIRRRLEKCKHANMIIDLNVDLPSEKSNVLTTRTVQPFLYAARGLKDWLVHEKICPQLEPGDDSGWGGIRSWDQWRKYALLIAEAIASIHERRVIHGDIHPGNIMITDCDPPYAVESENRVSPYVILIDFDTASLFIPTGDTNRVLNHQYRAPERDVPLYVPTEQIDVYSFGKVLMYLATGQDSREIAIPPEIEGHERRDFIRRRIDNFNDRILNDSPRVLDIISRCTAYDSAARPTMSELVRLLKADPFAEDKLDADILSNQFWNVQRSFETLPPGPRAQEIFLRIAWNKVEELADLAISRDSDQVRIGGTRSEIIDYLVLLFQALKRGDSWTALTTPDVWVDSALGLDGRYLTATIEAIRNQASVRRFLAFSIEDVGEDWADQFATALGAAQHPTLRALGGRIRACLKDYSYAQVNGIVPSQSPEGVAGYQSRYKNRLMLILRAMEQAVTRYDLTRFVSPATEGPLSEVDGLLFALVPLALRKDIRDRRIKNPASLIHLNSAAGEEWLLVMTDISGRVVNETKRYRQPQLIGLRVYKSVFNVPQDRIYAFQDLLKNDAFNVGPCLKELYECFPNTVL